MKIGVVTWFGTGNFGTDLQSFAFCHYLEGKGHQVYLIQLFHYNLVGFPYTVRRCLGKFKNFIKAWLLGTKTKLLRYKIVQKYKKKYLNIYPLVTTKKEYINLLDAFDCFVSGSDQIWNPYHLSSFFLLDFAENKPRFAYASSLGVDKIPDNKQSVYIKNLKNFNFIGIREKTGVDVVNNLLGKNIAVQVLDPTFLLTGTEWVDLAEKIDLQDIVLHSYLLVYTIGRRTDYPELINRVRKGYGIEKLVVVNSVEGFRYDFADREFDKVSPLQFIYLLKNARFVCTDSFHATALSINMNVNFLNLLRFDKADELSQNSRVYDVLEHYNLSKRIYEGKELPKEIIDFHEVNFVLMRDRIASEKFIDKMF